MGGGEGWGGGGGEPGENKFENIEDVAAVVP